MRINDTSTTRIKRNNKRLRRGTTGNNHNKVTYAHQIQDHNLIHVQIDPEIINRQSVQVSPEKGIPP